MIAALFALALATASASADNGTPPAEAPAPVGDHEAPAPRSSAAAGDDVLHIVRVGPGCFGARTSNANLAGGLFDPMAQRGGSYVIRALNPSALHKDDRLLFPEASHLGDVGVVGRFLAHGGDTRREVLAESLDVLVTLRDLAFQWPVEGTTDYLALIEDDAARTGGFADLERKKARLVRYTRGDDVVLALEADWLAGGKPPAGDPLTSGVLSFDRRFAVLGAVKPKDDPGAQIFAFARPAGGGGAVKARLDALVSSLPAARTLVVHAGDVPPRRPIDAGETALCASTLAGEHVAAVVPRTADLELGVKGLHDFARSASLRYVAVNLRDKDGDRPFPRFRIVDVDGMKVALLGVVGSNRFDDLPSAVRAQWRVDPPILALDNALQAVHDQLRRWPDLTVVLSSADHEPALDLRAFPHVDLVFEGTPWGDFIERKRDVAVSPARGGRERQPGQDTSLLSAANAWSVSHATVSFAAADDAPPDTRRVLTAISDDTVPLLDGDPVDAVYRKKLRAFEEKQVARDGAILLPDPEPFIRAHDELHPLVWGDRVLDHQTWMKRERSWSPFVTDALWMHLVTNAMLRDRHVEVALAKDLKRGDDVLGALPRLVIEDWLATNELVLETHLTGAELVQVAARVAKDTVQPKDFLFAAGLDAKKGRIGGRAINPDESYSVAFSESVARIPELEGIFRGKEVEADKPPLHDVVLRELQAEKDPLDLLLDHSDVVVDKTTAGFDELSLTGSAFRNSDNIGLFASSRETRLANPDLYQLGAHVNAFYLYDGTWIASEWRALAQYDGIVVDIPGQDIPPQEQRDDIVLSSELRLNKVKLSVAGDAFQVIPFGQVAFDTEFTPVPLPNDPHKAFPHQLILRESAGLVAYPGPQIREVRLGALVQHDLSEYAADTRVGAVHHDAGVVAGYKLRVPLFWRFLYDSTLDLRFLVPDDDDRASDLALRMQWTHKLLLPLTEKTSLFLFVDAFVVSGKLDENKGVGWNAIAGAGIQLQELFKL